MLEKDGLDLLESGRGTEKTLVVLSWENEGARCAYPDRRAGERLQDLLYDAVKPGVFSTGFQGDNVFLSINVEFVIGTERLFIVKVVLNAGIVA